jgi:Right handed beta helix region
MNRIVSAALLVGCSVQLAAASPFTVINTNDSGSGSLRQAITDANNNPGADTIGFSIPGTGQKTITILTDLPNITEGVTIDGGNGGLASDRAQITNGGSLSTGLLVNASGCEIRNLVINGFTSRQILVINAPSNCRIKGCVLGENPAGDAIVTGSGEAIECINSGLSVGGTTAAERNVMSSVNTSVVVLSTSNATIQGNYIGLNKAGTAVVGTPFTGIDVSNAGATIGGTKPSEGNVIASMFAGIRFGGNPALPHSFGTAQGNLIGTDATGTVSLNFSNSTGIAVDHAVGVTINGNVIAGFAEGITISSSGISGASSNSNTVQGNFIGVAADGTTALGNNSHGIDIFLSNNNHIGGTNANEGNVIAHNNGDGVRIGVSTGNFVERNSIFSNGGVGVNIYGNSSGALVEGNSIFFNGGLGIDLDTVGPTLNDAGDADTGSNNLQNFPVLTSVTITSGNFNIAGTLNSAANTTYRIEFFANDEIDPSGFGEGKTFLGFANVPTDSSGNGSFNVSFPPVAGEPHVTATATDPNGNTSEFSAAIGQLLNISTRMRVLTGDNVLIGGFIITGSDDKHVIVRGIGPSLTSQGVPDALQDPTLELHDGTGALLASNDNWKDTQQLDIEVTGIPPTNDLESAIVATLPANGSGYTAILRGKNNTTGVGLVEAYDLNRTVNSKLANISTRGFVDTGDNVMIGGFIAGNGLTKVIVRAIAPSLTGQGVPGALQDPTLELHDGTGATIASNDNWKDTQQTEIEASTIPPTDDRESAIVTTLSPGPYTAIVRGKNNTTGVALIEVYNIQ